MRYSEGTVTTVGASATVTGQNTRFLGNVDNTCLFYPIHTTTDYHQFYEIHHVVSDTELKLNRTMQGSGTEVPYVIFNDYTYNYGFPLLKKSNANWTATLINILKKMEATIYAMPPDKSIEMIQFNTSTLLGTPSTGTIYYNDTQKTLLLRVAGNGPDDGGVPIWRNILIS